MAYVLGLQCPSISTLQFTLAVSAAGSKLIVPTYLGVKAEDLQQVLKGNAEPVDVLLTCTTVFILVFTVTLISRQALHRLRRQNAIAEGHILPLPKPWTRRPCYTICCCACSSFGLLMFVLTLVVSLKFHPMFSPVTLSYPFRTTCVNATLDGLDVVLNSIKVSIPVEITNPNPIEINVKIAGTVYEGVNGMKVGYVWPTVFRVAPRTRTLRSFGNPTEPTVQRIWIDITCDNVSAVGIPYVFNVTELFDLASTHYSKTGVRLVLPESGKSRSGKSVVAPLIVELDYHSDIVMKVFEAKLMKRNERRKEFQRSDLSVDVKAAVVKYIADLQATSGRTAVMGKLASGNGTVVCAPAEKGRAPLCSERVKNLMGKREDILGRVGITDCQSFDIPNAAELNKQEETKWIFTFFICLVGLVSFTLAGLKFLQEARRMTGSRGST